MTKLHFAGRLAACAILLTFASTLASAHDYALGALTIIHPWSRPTPPGALTAAGYLTIENKGPAGDRLIGASSSAADKVEIHQDSMTGGIMRMRPVPEGVAVAPRGSVKLRPGDLHLMIFGPKRPFKPGDRIPVSLRFEHAGVLDIDLVVEQPSMGGGAMGGMSMPGMR